MLLFIKYQVCLLLEYQQHIAELLMHHYQQSVIMEDVSPSAWDAAAKYVVRLIAGEFDVVVSGSEWCESQARR